MSEHPPLAELLGFAGRTAIVTGAARGIGAAVARRLAEAGATVIGADLSWPDEPPAALAQAVRCDVRAEDTPSELVDEALALSERVDILVNAAGIYPSRTALEMTDDEWDEVLDTNLRATFRCAREVARAMSRLGIGGVIVNMASNAGLAAGPASAHYVASKHGVIGLTKSLAVDFAASGIRVVGVAPGVTRTEGLTAREDELRQAGWGDLETYAARTVPLGRMASADEIARIVLFAASELSSFVSGATILADGGQVTSFS